MKPIIIGIWRKKYFGNKTSLIFTSIIIGLLSSLCAVLLKNGVHFIREWVHTISIKQHLHFLLFIFPTIGILLAVIYTKVFLKGTLGRGVTNIIYCISRKSSFVEKNKIYSQMLTSILTVGFGGSAGLEAPIASTGSAIGSNIARWLLFSLKERTILLACGAAAGISAIFNAPIAGVVFAFEVLLVDMPVSVIIPLLISSASASLLSHYIYSGQPSVVLTATWNSDHILYYIAFSFIASFVSVYAIRVYFFLVDLFAKKKKPFQYAIIGGLSLCVLIYLFPPLYGEGYETILSLLKNNSSALIEDNIMNISIGNWTIVLFAFALMSLKVVATSLTVGAGGNGGMFGSSLFTGAMCGYIFAHSINILGLGNLNEVDFTVIGMAALMSGIIHAPLTAIFLIAEITGGYILFVPLMAVSSITYMVTKYFEPFSVYTKKLAIDGDLINTNKDKLVLSKMHLRSYIEKDFISLKKTDTLSELVKAITHSKRNIFSVVTDDNILVGIILLDNVRELIFSKELYDTTFIKDLMVSPPAVIDIHDDMESILKKFDDSNAWNLPVTEKDHYLGFVSKSKIFTQYRHHLIQDADVPG